MKVLLIVCGILLGGVILNAASDEKEESQELKESGGDEQFLSKDYLEQVNSQRQADEYDAQLQRKRQERTLDRISNIR